MDAYAVFGNPVRHSLSPRIHGWFAEATSEQLTYSAIEAPIDDFAGALRAFLADGGRGANVTVPFKEAAATLADSRNGRVERSGAANTLRVEADGSLRAFNTDGLGLVRDLEVNLGIDLRGLTVILVGAGGAAAGVIEPLLDHGVTQLVVGNRTVARAEALVQRFADLGQVRASSLAALPPADLVINATAASLAGEVPRLPAGLLAPSVQVYDMMYAATPTPFLLSAHAAGATCTDGLGMLVEQAAEAFELWRGVRPDTGPILQRLRPNPLFLEAP